MNWRPVVAAIGELYDPAGTELLQRHVDLVTLDGSRPTGPIHGILPRYPGQVTAQLIAACPELLAVAASGRGVDNIDVTAATAAGVLVANNHGVGSWSVAEHTIGLMLALTRSYGPVFRAGLAHAWRIRMDLPRVDLRGRTLGIVGCGNVGSEVARRASLAFGMRVLAYDPYVDAGRLAEVNAEKVDDLHELLAASDIVTLHPELNAETTRMFDDERFAQMRTGAYFLNISRGKVVVTDALIRALRSGKLAGAALDVYDPEPPPPDSPLATMPNVLLTPHVADMTVEIRRALALSTAEQMLQMLAGQRPTNLVNPDAWDRFVARYPAVAGHSTVRPA